jgi:hypothetical protein
MCVRVHVNVCRSAYFANTLLGVAVINPNCGDMP